MPNQLSSTNTISINATLSETFATAIPADLTKVLLPKGALPGVREVTEKAGDWTAPGHHRRVIMTDGSSVLETLTEYDENEGVAYRIEDFKGPLGILVTHAEGRWTFSSLSEHQTTVSWTFTFHPRSRLTSPIVGFIAHRLWPGFAKDALARVKVMAERADAG